MLYLWRNNSELFTDQKYHKRENDLKINFQVVFTL